MAVHTFRYSIAFALKRILWSLYLWTLILLLPGAALLGGCFLAEVRQFELLCVMLALAAVLILAWLVHSRRYWKLIWDRSPQIEIHATYLRAKQLGDNDILLKDILDIRGQQLTRGEVLASKLILTVEGMGPVDLDLAKLVELDLAKLNVRMDELYWHVYKARQAVLAGPRPPGGPPSVVKAQGVDLGGEIARFRPGVGWQIGTAFMVGVGVALMAGTLVCGFLLYTGGGIPPVLVLVGVLGILAPALPLTIRAILDFRKVRRGEVVLYGDGLVYNGAALRYSEVWNVELIRGEDTTVALSLRDGSTLRLTRLKDVDGASRQLTEQVTRVSGGEKRMG